MSRAIDGLAICIIIFHQLDTTPCHIENLDYFHPQLLIICLQFEPDFKFRDLMGYNIYC